MQFRITSAFFIFIESYLPLAIILAVQDIPSEWWEKPFCKIQSHALDQCEFIPFKHPTYSIIFLLIAIASTLIANFSLRKISFPFSIEVTSSKSIPNDLINYVFPYVVSFMGINYGEPEKLLGFGVFLLWMFAITYKSGQIIINPLLLMLGWRLYEATINISGQSRSTRVMKKGMLVVGRQRAQTIQDLYIAKD